jgi:hypothetical protein
MIESKIIIGIPGFWKDRSDIVKALAEKSGGYLFLGGMLSKINTKDFFEMEIYDHDDGLKKAFSYAGNFTTEQLDAIERHTCTLYIIGKGGSIEYANKILDAGVALLNSGGVAIKVESSGIAHTPQHWTSLAEAREPYHTFRAFVTFAGEEKYYYSCGMHCLGYPDVVVLRNGENSSEVAKLMETFLLYNLYEKPTLKSGETFSIDANSPHYVLSHKPCTNFEVEHLFYNPYGVWELKKK